MTTTNITNSQTGSSVTNGNTVDVLNGGTIVGFSILSGGSAVISSGGVDSGSTIAAGGAEIVYGSANGDMVAGLQTVSTGTTSGLVTNETVLNGGVVYLSIKTTSAANTTVDTGGQLNLNGANSATNTTLSGGLINLESAKATLTGSLVFAGGGTLEVTGNTSAGNGDLAVISGFAAGSVIDITAATTLGAATGDTVTSSIVGGNTQITVSGGGVSDVFLFSGSTIGPRLTLTSDGAGGQRLIYSSTNGPVTSVGAGTTSSGLVVSAGSPLTVYTGGTIVAATVLTGGSATIRAGGVDSGTTVSAGGSETVSGTATGDSIFGTQTVSGGGVVSGEVVQSGGTVNVSGGGGTAFDGSTIDTGASVTIGSGGVASNTTIAGGTLTLTLPQASLTGALVFNGAGTLDILPATGVSTPTISGFYYGDVINLENTGTGGTLSTNSAGGVVTATVSSGGVSQSFGFAGIATSNVILTSSGGVAELAYAGAPTLTSYTPGDLVLSVYGNGAGTGTVSLDQAAPITLEEITQTGTIVGTEVLPETTSVVNGTTEYAISGEYESASEGILTLAGNGQSLTIAGYGVNYQSFDASNAASVYGTTALGQTTSILGGQYTAVERVVADISANGSIDTSTSIAGIFNTNNPRSVFTINGTTFYLSGQGNGADGTEGVFEAADGASSGTAIYNTKTDTREVTIYNGQLYVGADSKLNGGGGIYNFGATLPTTATTPAQLPGIGASIVLTAAEANSVNSAAIGTSVNLSPEQYFFANPTTLYVADGGDPKEGGLGDGGLQKWSLVNNSWTLDYTLSTGLNMIPDTQASGTTGLVGLTGTVEGSSVVIYASNETVAETDPTFLYAITDNLAATTAPNGESFTLLETAAPGTLIRGVAFAPSTTASVPQVTSALVISAGVSSGGLTIASPGSVTVLNGGTINGFSVLSGSSDTISSGGIESNTFLAHGATETVFGSATGDTIDGVQTISSVGATASNEVVENGGSIVLATKGTAASSTTVNSGGSLILAGQAFANATVISGGSVLLESVRATISGGLTFSGTGGKLTETVIPSAGFGDQETISNFGTTDVIDLASAGSAASLSTTVSGGNVIATVTSGTFSEAFTFAGSGGVTGSAYASSLSVTSDGAGGQEILYTPPPPVVIIVSANMTSSALTITSGNSIQVLSGGTMSGITVASGASATISAGGVDSGSTIQAGGFETVSGSATGDQIYGTQLVTSGPSGGTLPALVSNETVFNGGTLELYLKPDIATGITVSSGGTLLLSGNVSATNTTLEAGASMTLQSPKATISGSLVFNGAATLAFTTLTSAGFGAYASATASTGATFAVISGFGAGDVIDETLVGVTSATVSSVTSGGDTFETITGGTYPQTFVFSGTSIASHITEATDAGGGVELVYTACFAPGTRIRTPDGERPVETLREGDWLTKADGSLAPIVWTGQRRINLRAHKRPDAVQPVRLRAGALAGGVPSRDLIVSPDHAFLLEGHLIPAKALLNGATIAQLDWDVVTYHHVELAEHSVILAEGAAAESYLDTGNRHDFETGPVLSLHPEFSQQRRETQSCAPFAEHGPLVERVRAGILSRAAIATTTEPLVRLETTPDGVVLHSRSAVPGHLSPDPRDRRMLGIKVAALEAGGRSIALDDQALVTGWHELEPDGRWTNGAAIVPASLLDRPESLRITIAATQRYPLGASGQERLSGTPSLTCNHLHTVTAARRR